MATDSLPDDEQLDKDLKKFGKVLESADVAKFGYVYIGKRPDNEVDNEFIDAYYNVITKYVDLDSDHVTIPKNEFLILISAGFHFHSIYKDAVTLSRYFLSLLLWLEAKNPGLKWVSELLDDEGYEWGQTARIGDLTGRTALKHMFHEYDDLVAEYKLRVEGILYPPFDDSEIKDSPGYVYFIKDVERSGEIKIGRAKSVTNRKKRFDVKLPFKTELLHEISCRDYKAAEAYFHQYFSKKRSNGEWFALNDRDIAAIKKITEM